MYYLYNFRSLQYLTGSIWSSNFADAITFPKHQARRILRKGFNNNKDIFIDKKESKSYG